MMSPTEAAAINWNNAEVRYVAQGQDIKDVLRDFAASEGIPASIGESIRGTVTGRFSMPAQRFLDTLAATFSFVWYYDGHVLDIVAPADMEHAQIELDSASAEQLSSKLARMGVADKRFPLVYDDEQGAVIVNGPPGYVRRVANLARQAERNAPRSMGDQTRVFPLEHASATDRTIDLGGQPVVIPGVATLLNNIYHPHPEDVAGASKQRAFVTRDTPMQPVYGADPPDGAGDGSGAPSRSPHPRQARAAAPGDTSQRDRSLPVIEADPRTNSVLIRDWPDRMYQYPRLLNRLDVKPRLIEVEARIIEVRDSDLHKLGVDWKRQDNHVDAGTGNSPSAHSAYNGDAALPAGSLSTVLDDGGRYLMSHIDALVQDGEATVDASPKVTTLDNLEAVMNDTTRFFVPVSGPASGDLYSVSTGVSVRVLPKVVEDNGTTQIKLDVTIRDGQLSTQTVSNLPVIRSTDINALAFVSPGQALLVAGYHADDRANVVAGAPGLSKIPVIGGLFRGIGRQQSHVQRLFLISPRIIEP